MNAAEPTVLILGAGINGCALARELILNNVSVWLVDTADIASGATSGSSRLIHGGLRYLEYGEFDLVKESLAERARLLRLAPQFVRPLQLWIPTSNRLGGLIGAIGRFFHWPWWPHPVARHGRGIELVRAGLMLYDAYARDPQLPKHQVHHVPAQNGPAVDASKYRWLASYYDAQVEFPERLVLALLDDARAVASQRGIDFQVLTYHQTAWRGGEATISPLAGATDTASPRCIRPAALVNATGAWVDLTLQRLQIPSKRLMGPTKGTHCFSACPRLREALAGQGVYGEASDGRPIFITPLGSTVLIGTTDDPFEAPPEDAIATTSEVDYLIQAVNAMLPSVRLTRQEIDFHYSGVRPLPYVDATTPGAVTRRHGIVHQQTDGIPLISLIGGKLTTMRSFAETAAADVLGLLHRAVSETSRDRVIPGGESYPQDQAQCAALLDQWSRQHGLPRASVAAVWQLCGMQTERVVSQASSHELLPDNDLPVAMAHWSIQHEYATTLADLVERRLMLLYDQRLTVACLRRLAELLAAAGRLSSSEIDRAVLAETARLRERYGKQIA